MSNNAHLGSLAKLCTKASGLSEPLTNLGFGLLEALQKLWTVDFGLNLFRFRMVIDANWPVWIRTFPALNSHWGSLGRVGHIQWFILVDAYFTLKLVSFTYKTNHD